MGRFCVFLSLFPERTKCKNQASGVGSELFMFIELSYRFMHSDIVINLEGRNDLSYFNVLYPIFLIGYPIVIS